MFKSHKKITFVLSIIVSISLFVIGCSYKPKLDINKNIKDTSNQDTSEIIKEIPYFYEENEIPDFDNFKWGMNPGQVAYLQPEKNYTTGYSKSYLSMKYNNINPPSWTTVKSVDLQYTFNENKQLAFAFYYLKPTNEDDSITCSNDIIDYLTLLYGEAVSGLNESAQMYMWQTETTDIVLVKDMNRAPVALTYASKHIKLPNWRK